MPRWRVGAEPGSVLSVESNQNVESKTKNVESISEKNVESKIAFLLFKNQLF